MKTERHVLPPSLGRARAHGESRSWANRLLATALGALVASAPLLPPRTAAAQPSTVSPETDRAKQLNATAQERYARGDLGGAGDTYAEIFNVLTENRVNREERDNTLLITLEVYREAFYRRKGEAGENALKEAVEYLRRAVRLFDNYEAEYRRVYGSGASVSLDAQKSGQETKDLLAQAEKELGLTKPEEPKPVEKKDPILKPISVPPGPSGVGLIVAGSIMLAAGLGTMAMIIVGDSMARKARRDRDRASDEGDDDALDDANRRGQTGNVLIITGAVFTALFIAGGATMLGIGIHRRVRYVAFSPTVGRGYAGLSLRGRF